MSIKIEKMQALMKRVFCEQCGDFVDSFQLQEVQDSGTVNGKMINYIGIKCFCDCGTECYHSVLTDENKRSLYEAYRKSEEIVSYEIIEDFPRKYNIGIRPLSLALGWGELTYTRFMRGDLPSKEYSALLVELYESPSKYREILCKNNERISESALKKSLIAVDSLIGDVTVDLTALGLATYIKSKFPDTTDSVALQKLLYYIQGFYSAFTGENCFELKCFAWEKGPVYPAIYYLNKEGRLEEKLREIRQNDGQSVISAKLLQIAEIVCESFGVYSGDVLKDFTHDEDPWKNNHNETNSCEIKYDDIRAYFTDICEKYQITSVSEIQKYASAKFDDYASAKFKLRTRISEY